MKNIIFSLLVIFLFVSCGSGRIKTTETNMNEAIVFGRFVIKSDADYIKKADVRLHFNERLMAKNYVRLDENGYFYMKLPLGHNFLALVEYQNKGFFYKNITKDYASVTISDPNLIYYIGDIILNWNISNEDKRSSGGTVGAIQESKKIDEDFSIIVSQTEETVKYFNQLFPDNNKRIVNSLLFIEE